MQMVFKNGAIEIWAVTEAYGTDPIDLDKATRRAVDEAVDWDRAFGAGAA
jgi:hypothetical protein